MFVFAVAIAVFLAANAAAAAGVICAARLAIAAFVKGEPMWIP